VSELYERLLAEAHTAYEIWAPEYPAAKLGALRIALVAVLELHKPRPCSRPCSLRHEHVMCTECGGTVRAIARALDVPIGDRSE